MAASDDPSTPQHTFTRIKRERPLPRVQHDPDRRTPRCSPHFPPHASRPHPRLGSQDSRRGRHLLPPIKNPKWIARRCARYVPRPELLVPAIDLVYATCENATDVKTGLPLFSTKGWEKATASLLLAKEGFLSDLEGVPLYEEAGRDKYGLRRYWCTRGTGPLEEGPHGDIYSHFGALNGARTSPSPAAVAATTLLQHLHDLSYRA